MALPSNAVSWIFKTFNYIFTANDKLNGEKIAYQ